MESHEDTSIPSPSHLQEIFDTADIVVFSLDKDYCYTFYNKKHENIMRQIWGVDIALGENMLDFITDDTDRQKAKQNFDSALSGNHFTLEEEYGDEAKHRQYYEDKYSPVLDKSGRVKGVSVIVSDITARRRAENERLRKDARFKHLFNFAGDGVVVHDEKWNLIEVNSFFSDLLNYPKEELIQLNIVDLGVNELSTRKIMEEAMQLVLVTGRADYESTLIKKNGEEITAHIISSKIEVEDKILIQSIVRDVTDSRQQEYKLKKYHSLFHYSTELLAVANLDGYFEELSPRWTTLVGYTLEELKSKPIIKYIHPDDQDLGLFELDKLQQNKKETVSYENRFKKRKGGYINVEWNSFLDVESKLIYSVARDVTQLRKREKFAIDSQNLFIEITKKSHLMNIDFSDFVEFLISKSARLLGIDFCSFWNYDEVRNEIVCEYDSKGRHESGNQRISGTTHPEYFKAIRNELTVAVPDVKEDVRTSEFIGNYFEQFAVKSLLDVQLSEDSRFTGVICFESLTYRNWTFEEQSVVSTIANIFNQASANSKLNRTKLELQKEQELFKTFAENLPAMVYIKHAQGKHIYGNKATLSEFGVTQEKFKNSVARDLIGEEIARKTDQDDLLVIETGQNLFNQIQVDGGRFLNELKFKISDNLIGGITFDITDRVEREKALAQKEIELLELQKIAKLGYYNLNFETRQWTSSVGLNIVFGIDESYKRDFDGLLVIIHPDFKDEMKNYIEEDILMKKKPSVKEYQITDQVSGDVKWVRCLGKVEYDIDGNAACVMGTIQDVTHQKNL